MRIIQFVSRDSDAAVRPPFGSTATDSDSTLFDLAEELNAAEYAFRSAAASLACAERRLQRLAEAGSGSVDIPPWYIACEEAEANARTMVESICEQITNTPSVTKAGLAFKLRLLAALYEGDPADLMDRDELDPADALLQSALRDVHAWEPEAFAQ